MTKWTLIEKLEEGGHRLFRWGEESAFSRHAIADNSGSIPDRTDDGVLWLDMSLPLVIGDFAGRLATHVPLEQPIGPWKTTSSYSKVAAVCGLPAGLALKTRFSSWKVEYAPSVAPLIELAKLETERQRDQTLDDAITILSGMTVGPNHGHEKRRVIGRLEAMKTFGYERGVDHGVKP